ncbi:MAG TPA: hypothetical protein DCQ51_03910, partial [Planktothrix sp. UBA8407]|nr:hypothetical protein [Planktothrix sp. UBA8407]
MRLSTVTFLTLAALVAQDSGIQASPIPEATSPLPNASESGQAADAVEMLALAPSLAVSMPEMIGSPSFSSTEFSSNILDQTWLAKLVK